MSLGHRTWVFPDGDLPPHDPYDPAAKNAETHGHESLVLLNTGGETVYPVMTVYFADRDPWRVELPEIAPRRVRCYRTDEPVGINPVQIPEGQYALVIECNAPVVAQIGRMDIRQPNLAYYTVMGYPTDSAAPSVRPA
ncbi:MAG TPA: sensory rhodopsin transducer [Chthoniobacteraceae bacterium]|nr:sensory rhodopsin transducer [Chthoniobacteraceae bacterium]